LARRGVLLVDLCDRHHGICRPLGGWLRAGRRSSGVAAAADTTLGARVALWGVREAGFLIFASLVAGFATMPYAA
jgi:hypothetical protein